MATRDSAKVFGAHTARIMINGKEFGFMLNVSWSIDNGVQDVFAIGSTEVQEHQQTRRGISGEVQQYYLRDAVLNPDPSNPLSAKTSAEVLQYGTFDLMVIDDVTKKPICTLVGCTLATEGAGVQAGQLVTQRFGFRALRRTA